MSAVSGIERRGRDPATVVAGRDVVRSWILAAEVLVASVGVSRASAPENVKAAISGVVAMGWPGFIHRGGVPDNSLSAVELEMGAISAIVVDVTWSEVQPSRVNLNTASLDRALEAVRDYNRKHPKGELSVKLRVFASGVAPSWAMELGGRPVKVLDNQGHVITIGRFWTPEFQSAWTVLQSRLAARYDKEPLIREVSVTGCTSRADEPFVLPTDRFSLYNLHAAGFTDAAYRSCLLAAPAAYRAWKQTNLDYTFNIFRSTDGGVSDDADFTVHVMTNFRREFRTRGSLMNHALSYPVRKRVLPILAAMRRLGPPVELQMVSPQTDYWPEAIEYAVGSVGAEAIELWPPYGRKPGFSAFSAEKLSGWARALRENGAR